MRCWWVAWRLTGARWLGALHTRQMYVTKPVGFDAVLAVCIAAYLLAVYVLLVVTHEGAHAGRGAGGRAAGALP